jgi:hypothetical protein
MRSDDGVHGVHHGFPGRTSLSGPDTSHLAIRRWDVDGVGVGSTAKREVGVGIQGESIGIGQEVGSSGDGTNVAVGNRDIRTLPFTNARDLTYHPVDFQVATPTPVNGVQCQRKKNATHKDVAPPQSSRPKPH